MMRWTRAHVPRGSDGVVDEDDAFERSVDASVGERIPEHRCDAGAGRSGAEDADALVCQQTATRTDGCLDRRQRDRGRALDVIVETENAFPMPVEQSGRVVLGEVLPLQKDVRPPSLHLVDELLEERVVLVGGDAGLTKTEVIRAAEAILVVCADVQHDRQCAGRVDTAKGRVQAEFADGDAHAAGALIAQAEDAFAIGGDDHVDLPIDRCQLLAHA